MSEINMVLCNDIIVRTCRRFVQSGSAECCATYVLQDTQHPDKATGSCCCVCCLLLTSREIELRVTSSLLPRSTTFVASFRTKRNLPPCPAAAHSRVTDPKSSCLSAGTAVACAAAMLKAADANAGEDSRVRSCASCTVPIASSGVRSDVAGSSSSTRHSESAGTPSHLHNNHTRRVRLMIVALAC